MSSRWVSAGGGNPKGWRVQRARILARDGFECQMRLTGCTGNATEVDHMVAWSPGALIPDHQLQGACRNCNAKAGSPEQRNPEVPRPSWL